jgi:hypothetical protein
MYCDTKIHGISDNLYDLILNKKGKITDRSLLIDDASIYSPHPNFRVWQAINIDLS